MDKSTDPIHGGFKENLSKALPSQEVQQLTVIGGESFFMELEAFPGFSRVIQWGPKYWRDGKSMGDILSDLHFKMQYLGWCHISMTIVFHTWKLRSFVVLEILSFSDPTKGRMLQLAKVFLWFLQLEAIQ